MRAQQLQQLPPAIGDVAFRAAVNQAAALLRSADAVLVCAGAGMSACEGSNVYVSPPDFAKFYPDMPRRWGIRTAYECMGLSQRQDVPREARAGFSVRHMHNMSGGFPLAKSYELLKDLLKRTVGFGAPTATGGGGGRAGAVTVEGRKEGTSSCGGGGKGQKGGDNNNSNDHNNNKNTDDEDDGDAGDDGGGLGDYFVHTSNVDDHFLRSGFDPSRLYTPQGSFSFYQCLQPCRPDAVWPSRPMLDVALPLVNKHTGELPSNAVPLCRHCGGPTMGNVRGGRWFLHHGLYDAQQDRLLQWMDGVRRAGKRLAVLEVGVGFNTPSVTRFPMEAIVREHGDAGVLIRVNPTDGDVPDDINAVSVRRGWEALIAILQRVNDLGPLVRKRQVVVVGSVGGDAGVGAAATAAATAGGAAAATADDAAVDALWRAPSMGPRPSAQRGNFNDWRASLLQLRR